MALFCPKTQTIQHLHREPIVKSSHLPLSRVTPSSRLLNNFGTCFAKIIGDLSRIYVPT